MKKEIICHVGMFKAASTFIQSILNTLEKTVLLPRGIYTWTDTSPPRFPFVVPDVYQAVHQKYQQDGRSGIEFQRLLGPEWHHRPMNTCALTEYLSLFGNADSQQRLNDLLHHALADNSIHKVVCSHEDLVCGGCRYCDRADELIPRRNHVITGLKQVLKGMDVKILLIVRRQDCLLESMYNTQVAYHLVTASFASICDWFSSLLHYDSLLDILIQTFGKKNISLLFFEELREDQLRFVNRFLQNFLSDAVADSDSTFTPTNASLSPDALRIMRYANKVLRKKYHIDEALIPTRINAELESERCALQQTLYGFKKAEQDRHDYELASGETNLLLAQYRESNTRLFDHYLASDSPDQKWRSYYLGR
jgi:hypothetical protein